MAENPLVRKMKLAAGARAAIIGAPPGYISSLGLPSGMKVSERLSGRYDWIQLFVKSRSDLKALLGPAARALEPTGLLWIAFPKASSGAQTDLSRDRGWDSLKKHRLKWISLVSVDGRGSAFAFRPFKPGDSHRTTR